MTYVEWIQLAKNKVHWWASVNTVINLRFHKGKITSQLGYSAVKGGKKYSNKFHDLRFFSACFSKTVMVLGWIYIWSMHD